MNNLVEYGIQNELSDMRIHIGIVTQTAYVFKTSTAQELISRSSYKCVPVYTESILTAQGYLVPPEDIEALVSVPIPAHWLKAINATNFTTTSQKGNVCAQIAKRMIELRLIPLPIIVSEITDKQLQVEGSDLRLSVDVKIQVKCDMRGGYKHLGGTGNLFLQIAEANPFKRH